jgi:octaheme c-type cytochrome (tetrathionate reductase family)
MKKSGIPASLLIAGLLTGTSAADPHQEINGPFENPLQVTETCLACHEDAASQMMKTTHWTWTAEQQVNGRSINRGKKNTINNFCISVDSANWPRCTSCHISYGWKDADFDLTDQSRMDCLICHDRTGTYKKPGPAAGMPAGYTGNPQLDQKKVDLLTVARNVGVSSRDNCGSCHFYGGGGENVKHGDLDSSLVSPGREIDFHMAADGLNFSCQECHRTENHQITGHAMAVTPGGQNHITCTDCHAGAVHGNQQLDGHTATVACQTCHIPTFAKGKPTMLSWDWSTAGEDREAKTDEFSMPVYDKKKGTFVWAKNVVPSYRWYNGNAGTYEPGDKIEPAGVTRLNWPEGGIKDMNARIHPFKVHQGKQIYDTKNMYFIKPKVWPTGGDDTVAYWKNYDWSKAAVAGMKAAGMEYSGEYGFAATEMYLPINHMVAPAEEALQCSDCHGKNGRLNWAELGYSGDPMKNKEAARMK